MEDLESLEAQLAELEAEQADVEKRDNDAKLERLQALGNRLQTDVEKRVTDRRPHETRWLRNIKLYNAQSEANDDSEFGSKVVVPLIRRICNVVEPRLVDLLFPTEERGWSIDPSPIPELQDAQALADKIPKDQPVGTDGTTAKDLSLAIREQREEAKSRAINMQRQIDDRFAECNYPLKARKAIHQGIVYGTGVLKGPHVLGRVKKKWSVADGAAALQVTEDLSPVIEWVDVWDYYPDLTARCPEDSESDFERHFLSAAALAKLSKQPGFEMAGDRIREALKAPPGKRDNTRDQLRHAAGAAPVNDNRYTVWEYHGPVTVDELKDCGCDVPDDTLQVYEGVIWFLDGGLVLKAAINPMDTDARPYSVFNWQADEASIFGSGIPDELADLATAANSTIRATLDNQGLTVKPQIAINMEKVYPLDGVWDITPGKMWGVKDKNLSVNDAFAFFQIDAKAQELMNVFTLIKQLIDEVGGPAMAMQGQDSPALLQTDLGKSIAVTSANVWMRRAVRNWDDQMTTPIVSRFLDWEMQYNPDESIKGDYHAQARGTSALLEAEGQAQKMVAFIQLSSDLPMPIRHKIAQRRQMAKAMRIDPADVLPNDDETREMEEAERAQAGQQQPLDPSQVRLQIAQLEIEDKEKQRAHEAAMMDRKEKLLQMQIEADAANKARSDELKANLDEFKTVSSGALEEQKLAHDAQKFNAELVVKQTQSETANYGLE